MPITADDIDNWLSVPSENQNLEFKAARTQFDSTKLNKYCVAIANEGGGHLVLGITDAPPRRVVGTAAIHDPVGKASKIFRKLGFRVDLYEVEHADGRVVVCSIPCRPLGTAYQFEGAYLMRSGEELVSMSEDRLREIFAEGKPDWLESAAVAGLSAQEVVELLDTQSFFDLMGMPFPSSRDGVVERLVSERLVMNGRGYSISRLGATLLAKDLTKFPGLSSKAARVVVYDGTTKLNTQLDRTELRGYAVGFEQLVEFVMSQLPQNEVIKGALRQQVKLVPEIAVRELVANALIHQDFSVEGTRVMIELYDNRLEISNPGKPVVPTQRFIDGFQSRNVRLAELMRRFGICEEQSSGIDKVINAVETFQLPPPDFRETHLRTQVVIYGTKVFGEMTREERIRACYQHCVLRWVVSEPMTNQSLRERLHLAPSKGSVVSQIIAAAVEQGSIKLDESVGGSRKFARYLPNWA